jgi:hypothetical protein
VTRAKGTKRRETGFRVTTYALTLVFKCRRCFRGDVVFSWQPSAATFPMEGRCSGCRAVHQLGVELVRPQPDDPRPSGT